jgi:hypothetical protein
MVRGEHVHVDHMFEIYDSDTEETKSSARPLHQVAKVQGQEYCTPPCDCSITLLPVPRGTSFRLCHRQSRRLYR